MIADEKFVADSIPPHCLSNLGRLSTAISDLMCEAQSLWTALQDNGAFGSVPPNSMEGTLIALMDGVMHDFQVILHGEIKDLGLLLAQMREATDHRIEALSRWGDDS